MSRPMSDILIGSPHDNKEEYFEVKSIFKIQNTLKQNTKYKYKILFLEYLNINTNTYFVFQIHI